MALLELHDLGRTFNLGTERFDAIRGINMNITRGEFVALVGASGSGKSTLLNIIGCLDASTTGTYRLAGNDISKLDTDRLAELRRKHFGFVFQRYHLLSSLTALGNVEVPAIYSGISTTARKCRAQLLLTKLGLEDRLHHLPAQMSGGQQQRVSIARALMNGGEIILADEPTGALDSSTGRTVLDLLKDLHAQGHTIIMVTHDMDVAEHADRIIEIRDGQIVSDRQLRKTPAEAAPFEPRTRHGGYLVGLFIRVAEAAKIALRSIAAHRLRSSLTLFGIVVGILAVISVVALGEGGRRIVLDQINSLGANSISILPGKGWDDPTAKTLDTLTSDDAAALQKQSYVNSVSPLAKDSGQLMFENRAVDGIINGVSIAYFDVAQRPIAQGGRFTSDDDRQPLQEAIIDDNARKTLFGEQRNPLGEILVVKGAPFVIVGIIGELSGSLGQDKRPQIFIPYMSLSARITGSQRLSEILVRINPGIASDVAESAMVSLLEKRHGTRDFFTFNSDQMRQTIETTTRTFSILVIAIAAVALLVGGVGVMNIMLVSVTERTAEIGLRMAVGAQPSDIKLQFLIEALAITLLGCAAGVALAFGVGSLAWTVESPIPMMISFKAVATGCLMATLIGVVFGFFPARKAAGLSPVQALAQD